MAPRRVLFFDRRPWRPLRFVVVAVLLACERGRPPAPAAPGPALAGASDPAGLIASGWELLERAGDRDSGAALDRFVRARAVLPDAPLAVAGEGIARAMGGDAAGAEPLLRRALAPDGCAALVPRNRLALTHFALGNLLFDGGRTAEAEPEYRAAVADAATGLGRASALAQIARIELDGNRLDAADATLADALAACPENGQAHFVRATLMKRRGDADAAARELRIHELLRAIEESSARRPVDVERLLAARRDLVAAWPGSEAVRLELIRALVAAGRYGDAELEAAALLQAKGPSAPLAWLLARAQAGRGDLAGATKARALMLRLDPRSPPALDEEIVAEWRRGGVRFTEAAAARLLAEWRRR